MDTDQASLLTNTDRGSAFVSSLRFIGNGRGTSRWRGKILLLAISVSIAVCLSVYLYLNMVAIDSNQANSGRYKPLSRRKPMLDHESIFSESGPSMLKLSDLLAHCIVALRIAGNEVVNLSLAHNKGLDQVRSKGKTLEGVDDIVTGADMKSHRIILNTIKDTYRRLNVVSEEDSTKGYENTSVEDDILPIERNKFAQLLRSQLHEIEDLHADRGSLIAQHETLVWIDPLDATKEYSENLTSYVTLMACIVHRSIPIAGVVFKPFTNQTYWSKMNVATGKFHHSPDLSLALAEVQKPKLTDDVRIIVSRSHAGNVKNVLMGAYKKRVDIISAGGSGFKTIELISGKADAYMHLTHIKKWDICAPHAILNSIPEGKFTDLNGDEIRFGDPKDKVVTQGVVASLSRKVYRELIQLTRTLKNNGN